MGFGIGLASMVGALILLPLRIPSLRLTSEAICCGLLDHNLELLTSNESCFFWVFFVLSNILDYSILVSVASVPDFD